MITENLYLIKNNNESWAVRAEDSLQAVTRWIETKNIERKHEGLGIKFNPNQFTVELINREI